MLLAITVVPVPLVPVYEVLYSPFFRHSFGLSDTLAGIPTIIKPFFGDQFFWADRVEALGIGSGVRKLTVEALTDALVSATSDVKQVERARMIGTQIRAENGVSNAIQALYRDLDYARSLVKTRAEQTPEDATIREAHGEDGSPSPPGSPPPESEWSVIEDSDSPSPKSSRRPSFARRRSSASAQKSDRPGLSKRQSLVANMTHVVSSVLPGALTSPTMGTRKSPM
jgi:sterol 3beta-glucosyltransferase